MFKIFLYFLIWKILIDITHINKSCWVGGRGSVIIFRDLRMS